MWCAYGPFCFKGKYVNPREVNMEGWGKVCKSLGLRGIIEIVEFCLILMIEAVNSRERKRPVLGFSVNLWQTQSNIHFLSLNSLLFLWVAPPRSWIHHGRISWPRRYFSWEVGLYLYTGFMVVDLVHFEVPLVCSIWYLSCKYKREGLMSLRHFIAWIHFYMKAIMLALRDKETRPLGSGLKQRLIVPCMNCSICKHRDGGLSL